MLLGPRIPIVNPIKGPSRSEILVSAGARVLGGQPRAPGPRTSAAAVELVFLGRGFRV